MVLRGVFIQSEGRIVFAGGKREPGAAGEPRNWPAQAWPMAGRLIPAPGASTMLWAGPSFRWTSASHAKGDGPKPVPFFIPLWLSRSAAGR